MSLPTSFKTDINTTGILGGKLREGGTIYEESATQLYPIGYKVEVHGRTWVYCRAAEAITLPHRGSPNLVDYPWIATSLYSLKGIVTGGRSVGAAGRKSIVVESDDYAHDTSPYAPTIKNFFAGGYCMIYYSSSLIGCHRITGSDPCVADATTGTSENITLYFDEALPTAIDASCTMDVYPSPYMCCGNGNSGTVYSSFVCVPPIAVTADYFFWGQVQGPCWVTPNAGITTAKVRDVAFHTNGTIITPVAGYQRAGYIIYKGDGSQDDAMIMLNI
jgi:hypothetical protein